MDNFDRIEKLIEVLREISWHHESNIDLMDIESIEDSWLDDEGDDDDSIIRQLTNIFKGMQNKDFEITENQTSIVNELGDFSNDFEDFENIDMQWDD